MTLLHQYWGVELTNMTPTQEQTFVQAEQAKSRNESDAVVYRRLQTRIRLDNHAAIFRAVTDDTDRTVAKYKQWLATTFGVPVSSISSSATTVTFDRLPSTIVTFTYNSLPRIKVAAFAVTGAYPNATLEESRLEALAYIKLHEAEWEPAVAS